MQNLGSFATALRARSSLCPVLKMTQAAVSPDGEVVAVSSKKFIMRLFLTLAWKCLVIFFCGILLRLIYSDFCLTYGVHLTKPLGPRPGLLQGKAQTFVQPMLLG